MTTAHNSEFCDRTGDIGIGNILWLDRGGIGGDWIRVLNFCQGRFKKGSKREA